MSEQRDLQASGYYTILLLYERVGISKDEILFRTVLALASQASNIYIRKTGGHSV